jgi:TonB family protein
MTALEGRIMKPIALIGLLLAACPSLLGAADSLDAARDLYASAAYEEALSMLGRLNDPESADVARQVDQYRAFCLFALGRAAEAESLAESIIRRDPSARLDAADASPRVEAMFAGVRQRLLPSLIRDRFRMARSGLDEKNFPAAEPYLIDTRRMIAEAEDIGVEDEGLADLRVLVDGFLELMKAAGEQATAARASTPDVDAIAPSTAAPPPLPAPRLPAAAARPAGPRVYSVGSQGVTPPTAIEQRMPTVSIAMGQLAKAARNSGKRGIVDVVVDETGEVVDVIIRESLHSSLDRLIATAARQWKYQPAMKDGVPVRFAKTITLVVP